MNWIKDTLVDITVTLLIMLGVFLTLEWAGWIIRGYTVILLLAKIIVYFGDNSLQLIRKTDNKAPNWIFHLLYGLNTFILAYGEWWITAAGWLVIWIVSWLSWRKLSRKSINKKD